MGSNDGKSGLKAAQRIKAELETCRLEGDSVEDYLWTALSEFRQSKTCNCRVGVTLDREREEEDKLHEFLKGLYGSVKSRDDPLPSLEEAYSAVSHTKHTCRVLNDKVAYAVRTGSSEDWITLVCNLPKGRENTGTAGGGSSSGTHTSRLQLTKKPRAKRIKEADRIGLTGLNDEQWRTVVSMLNKRKQSSSSTSCLDSWLVDSGASCHMTFSLLMMSDIREIRPVPICLGDGRFIFGTKLGRAVLSSTLTLRNVLFVDGLDFHIISVSQLSREQRSVIQITDKICLIQDRITRSLIGVAEVSGNLYYLVRGMELAGAMHHVESVSRDCYVSPLRPWRALAYNFKLFFRWKKKKVLSVGKEHASLCA